MQPDLGVDDGFLKRRGTELPTGGAARFVLVRESTPDQVLPRISAHGGHVIQTSLSEDAEDRLRAALAGTAAS